MNEQSLKQAYVLRTRRLIQETGDFFFGFNLTTSHQAGRMQLPNGANQYLTVTLF